jgi:membrane-bound metal-dependent hydrolase YbcI (DUF457 family)
MMVKEHMPSPFGHALAGVAAAWTADLIPGNRAWRISRPASSVFARAGGPTTLVCGLLGALPDIDLASRYHRSMTHSVTAVVAIFIIAAVVTRWVTAHPTRVWRIAAMCAGAYATHLALDWLGVDRYMPAGLQMLWPFSSKWYISGVDLFPQTERRRLFSAMTVRINLVALAWETVVLLPVLAGLWLIRIKSLARFASELSRCDHPTE